jgi:dephospho-CoA kinase
VSKPRIIGPAVINKIAARLRECGYLTVTADQVARQLRQPGEKRDIIGNLAAHILQDFGDGDWVVQDAIYSLEPH